MSPLGTNQLTDTHEGNGTMSELVRMYRDALADARAWRTEGYTEMAEREMARAARIRMLINNRTNTEN